MVCQFYVIKIDAFMIALLVIFLIFFLILVNSLFWILMLVLVLVLKYIIFWFVSDTDGFFHLTFSNNVKWKVISFEFFW